jgi:hypothetical protein
MAQESPLQGYCHVHMEERENDLQEIAVLINVICTVVKSRLTYLATMAMEQWKGIVEGTVQFSPSLSEQL